MTVPPAVVVVGIDADHGDRNTGEHEALALAERLGDVTFVSIHVLTAPEPHYAAVLESATPVAPHTLDGLTGYCVVVGNDDPIPPAEPLAHAIGEHRTRHNGRLVRFPGQERLRGTVALTEVTSGTAIDTIDCLGDTPGPDAVLRTQEFVRPILRDGTVQLVIQPYDGVNEYVPFEQPNPHPCCGHH